MARTSFLIDSFFENAKFIIPSTTEDEEHENPETNWLYVTVPYESLQQKCRTGTQTSNDTMLENNARSMTIGQSANRVWQLLEESTELSLRIFARASLPNDGI